MKKDGLINYSDKGNSYDEFFGDSLKIRKHAQKTLNFLSSLKLEELKDINSATISTFDFFAIGLIKINARIKRNTKPTNVLNNKSMNATCEP